MSDEHELMLDLLSEIGRRSQVFKNACLEL